MPIYSFQNKTTGEEFEEQMSMDELDKYLKKNKHIRQILTKINVVDPVGIGVTKPPSDFQKYVLGRVKEAPGAASSAIDRRWGAKREW
jgi:uncharacterized protein YnzC (UPF0291/DUF896 family)